MEHFLTTETLIIELLLIASLVAIVVQRLRVPYTVALVIVGLAITFQQRLQMQLTPELILALFVPPLVFEAAFHIDLDRLRESLASILVLAVPGVLLTMLIVGLVVSGLLHLPLRLALVFGALVSATDPVAVVSLFRTLGVPQRLATIVEGESLFNDGTAIVVFNLALAAALPKDMTATSGPVWLPLVQAVVDFLRVSAGGIIVGMGLGWLTSKIIARIDNYLIETTLTTVLAFGSYLVAERLHFSGVLAVLGAGLIGGNLGPAGMSPTTRIVLFNFWEYLAFVANSLVFLLIGLDVNVPQLAANLAPIGVALLAVIMSRVIVVYGLAWLADRRGQELLWSYRHVLFWGGLRGALGLALALSIPQSIPERGLIQVMTSGVVLFGLLVQGTTMNLLLCRLGLVEQDGHRMEYERRYARLLLSRAALRRVHDLYRDGMISVGIWEKLRPELTEQVRARRAAQIALLEEQPALQAEALEAARREAHLAERALLVSLQNNGVISEEVYNEFLAEVDLELQRREDTGGQEEQQAGEGHS